jgi:transposase
LSIFAPHTTIYTRWKSWCESGVWDKILDSLASSAVGKLCIRVNLSTQPVYF